MNKDTPRSRRPRPAHWLALVFMLFLIAAVVLRIQERLATAPNSGNRPLAVEVVELAQRPFRVYMEGVGTIEAEQRIVVSSRVTATVLAVPNREGSRVEAGALLLQLDDDETRRELERQAALLERARSELDYWRKEQVADQALFDQGMLERRRMDDTRRRVAALNAALQEAEAGLQLVRLRQGWTRVTAPFTGYVQRNVVLPGEQVVPGSPLVELVAASPLKVVAPLAERKLERLEEGQTATVYLPAVDRSYPTHVHRIYPALDAHSRNATVELKLPEAASGLRPGMAAELRLLVSHDPAALVVPQQAVRRKGDELGVFVAEDGLSSWRTVSTGATQGGQVVLHSGVQPGDRVIVTPHPGLVNGRAVMTVPGRFSEHEKATPEGTG